ncbi:MAG: ribosomal-processing cysteine protease Prp [Oscillospiraceae bacterium]|nr:ribosomal-processing cysteine protease Prp [Oscillospiraceae bacterium]
MTKVKFFCSGGTVSGFEISGHTGAGEAGQDIVCSAVSSAAYLVANTVLEVQKIKADAVVRDGYMKFVIPNENLSETKVLTDGLVLHLTELQSQYPQHIKIERGAI